MTIIESPQRYGEVFTRRWVVETILDLTDYTPDRDLAAVRVVEPSCGTGAFLGPIVERLLHSAGLHNRSHCDLVDSIRAYDIQESHVETSRRLCRDLMLEAGMTTTDAHLLSTTWVRQTDFLLPTSSSLATIDAIDLTNDLVDLVVGNPPYIRFDDLDETAIEQYRGTWSTMAGRGDIYIGFFERSLRLLRPGGRVGFICADRWMRNQYGARLRKFVSAGFAVEHIWTMHDVDAFEAQVSAYPAITVLQRAPQGPVIAAETGPEFGPTGASELAAASKVATWRTFTGEGVQAHRLSTWYDGDDLWPTGTPARLALIEHLNRSFQLLHNPDNGTKVSIGVATGADKVYVTKDPTVAEPDRMLPLAMGCDLMSGSFEWQGNYLVNPWDAAGNLVSLTNFPLLAEYFDSSPELLDRHVAKKTPAGWYRTIDKVQPGLIDKPKLLLQDMKSSIQPVLEPGGFYPHHNLYYVTSDEWDLEVLGGLLLSRVAQAFIEAYCVKMRGGTLRFQAQYLKRIRVPSPLNIEPSIQDDLRRAFRTRDVDAATRAACLAYDISAIEYELDQ